MSVMSQCYSIIIDRDKGSGNALHMRNAMFIKFRCGRGVGRVLHRGPIHRQNPFVGRVLKERDCGVLEAL